LTREPRRSYNAHGKLSATRHVFDRPEVHTMTLSLETTIRLHPDAVWRDVDGEVVVLNVMTGQYYGLDDVGSHVWRLIPADPAAGITLASLRDGLGAEFEADSATLDRDVADLMQRLLDHQLIVVGP
jgi:hypothetical protein